MSILDKCLNHEKRVRARRNVEDRKAKELLIKQGIPFDDLDVLKDAKSQITVSDEEVMDEYVRIAGLVDGDPSTQKPTPAEMAEGRERRAKMEAEEKKKAKKTRVKTIRK